MTRVGRQSNRHSAIAPMQSQGRNQRNTSLLRSLPQAAAGPANKRIGFNRCQQKAYRSYRNVRPASRSRFSDEQVADT